jgi:hypothetical protein
MPKPKTMACFVCDRLEPKGQLLACKECRQSVHRACYGVTDARAHGKWTCDPCANDKTQTASLVSGGGCTCEPDRVADLVPELPLRALHRRGDAARLCRAPQAPQPQKEDYGTGPRARPQRPRAGGQGGGTLPQAAGGPRPPRRPARAPQADRRQQLDPRDVRRVYARGAVWQRPRAGAGRGDSVDSARALGRAVRRVCAAGGRHGRLPRVPCAR